MLYFRLSLRGHDEGEEIPDRPLEELLAQAQTFHPDCQRDHHPSVALRRTGTH